MSNFNCALCLAPIAAVTLSAHASDYLSVQQAQTLLFPSASQFTAQPLHFDSAQRDRIASLAGVRQRWATQKVWKAESSGRPVGWFVVDEVIGKHEFITYAAAISNDGKVLGVEILSYRETHGGQIRDAGWRRNFIGKTLGNPFKLDEDVPNITGATLSCRNVLDGVHRLLVIHKLFLANA